MGACAHVYMCVRPEANVGVTLYHSPQFSRQGLSPNLLLTYWLDWLAASFGIFLLSYPVLQLQMFRPAMSGFLSRFWRSELKPSCLCSLVRYWLELTPLDNFFMANPYRQILGGANAVLLPGIGDNGFWFLRPFFGGRWTVVSVASLCRKEGADDGRQETDGQEKVGHKTLFLTL